MLFDSILPHLTSRIVSQACSITPEGVDPAGAGGGGGQAPAAPVVPPASSLVPITRAPMPVPTMQPPAAQAPIVQQPGQSPAAPTPLSQQSGSQQPQYLTREEAMAMVREALASHSAGGQAPSAPPAPPQAPAAPPAAPAGPPPVHAPAPSPAAPIQVSGENVNELSAMQTALRQHEAELSRMKAERDQAEQKAIALSAETAAVQALVQHDLYRMQEPTAREAVYKMMSLGRIAMDKRQDGSSAFFVQIPNEQGRTDVYPLKEGVAKWLDTQEGAFFKPRLPPGMGSTASTPGHAPASFPQNANPQPRSDLPPSLADAFRQQTQQNSTPRY